MNNDRYNKAFITIHDSKALSLKHSIKTSYDPMNKNNKFTNIKNTLGIAFSLYLQ